MRKLALVLVVLSSLTAACSKNKGTAPVAPTAPAGQAPDGADGDAAPTPTPGGPATPTDAPDGAASDPCAGGEGQ